MVSYFVRYLGGEEEIPHVLVNPRVLIGLSRNLDKDSQTLEVLEREDDASEFLRESQLGFLEVLCDRQGVSVRDANLEVGCHFGVVGENAQDLRVDCFIIPSATSFFIARLVEGWTGCRGEERGDKTYCTQSPDQNLRCKHWCVA